ncbi:MAG: hypothetical protein R3270_08170 [Gammaproteobacteria bacterium]|nr:hypothetical protein [Gammaproteobacteria bacterium]
MRFMKILAATAILAAPLASADPDSREITREWPAGDFKTVDIEANVGTVRVTGSDRDTISLKLTIEPDDDWSFSSKEVAEVIASAELDVDESGDTLILDLKIRGRGDNDIEENWILLVPEAMETRLEMNVGEVDIENTSGGVEAELNVGEMDIDVLAGDIDAETNVGDLGIRSRTGSPGRFDLEVNIGDVDLDIDGKDIDTDRGFLGGSIRHDAGGEDDVDATVNVGNLTVDID